MAHRLPFDRFEGKLRSSAVVLSLVLAVTSTTTISASALPELLEFEDGSKVETLSDWTGRRRNELIELFQKEMYGYFPDVPDTEFRIVKEDSNVLDGKVTYREVKIRFADIETSSMTVALFLPNDTSGPVPLVIGVGICGNHTTLDYDGISPPADHIWLGPCSFFADGRGALSDYWSVEAIIDRGYAFATYHDAELDADKNDSTDGIHGALRMDSIDAAGGDEKAAWGTIAAWAWGASRVVDYAEVTGDIDVSRVAIVGHSRRGKSALLAGAFDERFALTVVHQAGTGGDALSRASALQEPVFLMNWLYPYWFNRRYFSYNFNVQKLPIDQHQLLALVAPRKILINAAYSYPWAGFTSSLKAMHAADPAYELYGVVGVIGDGIITNDDTISAETVGGMTQYRRRSGHSLDPEYWQVILDVAAVAFETTQISHVER